MQKVVRYIKLNFCLCCYKSPAQSRTQCPQAPWLEDGCFPLGVGFDQILLAKVA